MLQFIQAEERDRTKKNRAILDAKSIYSTVLHEIAHRAGSKVDGELIPHLTQLAYGDPDALQESLSYWVFRENWIYRDIYQPITGDRSGDKLLAIEAMRKMDPEKISDRAKQLLQRRDSLLYEQMESGVGTRFRKDTLNHLMRDTGAQYKPEGARLAVGTSARDTGLRLI